MSRQFDVHANPLKAGREERPYLLDVQHAFWSDRPSRIVIPLVITSAIRPAPRLNPMVTVRGDKFYLSPTEMFTISTKHLRNAVANLEAERYRIISALDLVFTGI